MSNSSFSVGDIFLRNCSVATDDQRKHGMFQGGCYQVERLDDRYDGHDDGRVSLWFKGQTRAWPSCNYKKIGNKPLHRPTIREIIVSGGKIL